MREGGFQFAVLGSTPLALLLAGLLADRHKRSVCLVADSHAAFRLTRGFDLSVAPVTRPQTWALLGAAIPESIKLVGRIAGKSALTHLDPIFAAETPAGKDALGHVSHMARGFRHAVEPLPETPDFPHGATGIRFRDAVLLNRPAIEAGLSDWLDRAGVVRVHHHEAQAEFTILADDRAALEHGPGLLHAVEMTSVLTEPVGPLPSGFLGFLDRGVSLRQGDNHAVAALTRGVGDAAIGQIGAALKGQARRAGRASYVAAATVDGAPLLGLTAPGVFTIAGLGLTGAFLAPVIARFLAGESSAGEANWIDAHAPLAERALVAEVAL